MNTAIGQNNVTIRKTNFVSPTTFSNDPYEPRWGFSPVQREKILDPRECGISRVPYGELFPIEAFTTPRENHTIDWTKEKEKLETITADYAENILRESLGGAAAQGGANWGLTVGFYGETDAGKMKVISLTLLPSLSFIRHLATLEGFNNLSGSIRNACRGEDELDYGRRESCPTCWLVWLQSDACAAYMKYRAENGMQVVEENADGTITERLVKPTLGELETARDMILESLNIGIESLQKQWDDIVEDISQGGRKPVTRNEQWIRKDLHASKPQDMAVANAAKIAEAQSQPTTSAIERLAEAQILTNQILAQGFGGQPPAQSFDYSLLACSAKTKTGEDCQGKVTRLIDKKPFCSSHPVQNGSQNNN